MEPPIEADLPIIDAHHHIWDQPPMPPYRPFPIEVLAEDRRQSGHNIRATVFVECHYGYLEDGPVELRPVGETRAVEAAAAGAEAAGEHGLAAAIIGLADMTLGAGVDPILEAHQAESPTRFRGIRQITPYDPGFKYFGSDGTPELLRTPAFRESLKCLARRGLTFDALVLFPQMVDVAYLARSVPDATIILDHVGTPGMIPTYSPAEAFAVWRQQLIGLAACPNVFLKLGGLFMFPQDPPFSGSEEAAASIREYILPAIDIFTPERCMFESNFPMDELSIAYGTLWNTFKRLTSDFTRADREALFFHTAAKAYGIKI